MRFWLTYKIFIFSGHAPNAEETTSHAHHAKSTCPKHCYKYPETTNTPVLESTKRNMDVWCTENCKLGNCPPTMCTCDCRVPTQALVCNPVSKKFGANYDGAKWCHNTCTAGHCPKEYCDCHILYSLPRPVTQGLQWSPLIVANREEDAVISPAYSGKWNDTRFYMIVYLFCLNKFNLCGFYFIFVFYKNKCFILWVLCFLFFSLRSVK